AGRAEEEGQGNRQEEDEEDEEEGRIAEMSDKTEEATPKRLRKAQEQGDSPLSSFASQALAFAAALAVAPAAVLALSVDASGDLRAAIARAAVPSPAPSSLVEFDPSALGRAVASLSTPILLAAAVTGAVASVTQTGFVIATRRLAPDLSKLDPIQGFR